jgi:hypothetical protein
MPRRAGTTSRTVSPSGVPSENRQTSLVRITLEASFVVELEGVERLAGLRTRLEIPRDSITAMRFHAEYHDPGRAWRAAGTGLPRQLYAGNFRRAGRFEFWYLRQPRGLLKVRAENVLEVETTGRYARLLLSVSPDEAHRAIAWWSGATSTDRREESKRQDTAAE